MNIDIDTSEAAQKAMSFFKEGYNCSQSVVLAFEENFDFDRKKGKPGTGHCYSNSDIRQERKISEYDRWDVESCKKRREQFEKWIIDRWGVEKHYKMPEIVNEEDDIDVNLD